jgi:hypothetical protein
MRYDHDDQETYAIAEISLASPGEWQVGEMGGR